MATQISKDGLTKKQKTYIQAYLDNPYLSQIAICELAGVSPQMLCNWKKQPKFQEGLDKAMREHWKEAGPKAIAKIISLIDSSKDEVALKASTYLTDSIGFKAPQDININGEVGVEIKVDYGDEDSTTESSI